MRRKSLYREALRGLGSLLRTPANPVVVPDGMPATIEVGMGAGHVILARAQAEPARYFVGLEIKEERTYQAARVAEEAGLGNLVFVVGEIARTEAAIPTRRFDEILILFPDPWPKKRDVARRLFSARYLAIFERWMTPGARGLLRSDNPAVLELALAALPAAGCEVTSTCEDVAPEQHQTRYEARFRQEQQKIGEIRFVWPTPAGCPTPPLAPAAAR
jgi:tRNA (guanine-N(7)-)-methyltransferase